MLHLDLQLSKRMTLIHKLLFLMMQETGFAITANIGQRQLIENGKKPLIIYKMSRPLAQGKLWEHVFKKHSDRLIVIVNADDLRSSGVNISRCLSWEKTALDFVWQMASNPKLMPFSKLLKSHSWFWIRWGNILHKKKQRSRITPLL